MWLGCRSKYSEGNTPSAGGAGDGELLGRAMRVAWSSSGPRTVAAALRHTPRKRPCAPHCAYPPGFGSKALGPSQGVEEPSEGGWS